MWIEKLPGCRLSILLIVVHLWSTTAGRVRFRSGSHPRSLPSHGLKGKKTPIELHNISQERSCTEEEYIASYDQICPGGKVFGSRCAQNYPANDFLSANQQCVDNGQKMIQLATQAEIDEYKTHQPYIGERYWIGLYGIGENRKWILSNTKPTWTRWAPDQPNNWSGDQYCVEDRPEGWHDNTCEFLMPFTCVSPPIDPDVFRAHPTRLDVVPSGAPLKRLDELNQVTATCMAYLYRFEKVGLKVTYEYGPTMRFHLDECDNPVLKCVKTTNETYHMHGTRCVRKTTIKIDFDWDAKLDRATFNCYIWDLMSFNDTESKYGPIVLYDNKRPILRNVNSTRLLDGGILRWTCKNDLATDGDIASVALISSYGCGNWIVTVDRNNDQRLEMKTKSKCAIVTEVEIHQRASNRTQVQINIHVEARVTWELSGATIACFSYDAMQKWKAGTLLDTTDSFAAFSNPIEVIEPKPQEPKLTVNYHADDFTVYKNFDLTAYCDANVGEGGSILWTLKTKTTETKFAADGMDPTRSGIRIDQHPNKPNCPSEWTKNPASETCVKILDDAYSWQDARLQCQSQGSDLAQIFSSDGLQFLNNILGQDGYWIGLHDLDGDGHFAWWSNATTATSFDGDDWVRFEVRPKETDNAQCVYMYNDMWYTHGCHFKLRPVCEIPPPPNIPLDGEFLKISMGKKVRSVLTIKVDGSLEGATLACQVTGPTIHDEERFKKEIQSFNVTYGPTEPQYVTYWEIKDGKRIGHIQCSGNVGSGGHLSLVIFSGVELKYLYIIGVDSRVEKVKPALQFMISKLEVTDSPKDGPAMSLEVTVTTSSQLDSLSAKCYSRSVSADDHFDLELREVTQSNKAYVKSSNTGLKIAFAVLVMLGLMALATTKKGAKIHGKSERTFQES